MLVIGGYQTPGFGDVQNGAYYRFLNDSYRYHVEVNLAYSIL